MSLDRRALLGGSLALGGAMAVSGCTSTLPAASQAQIDEALADTVMVADIQRRTFDGIWAHGRDDNGLVADRWPTPSFCSIAAVGFALACYPIAVEAGWIDRQSALARTLATLRFFHDAPQGAAATGMTGHKGFFYHFLDMASGQRFRDTELSSIDSALLFMGMESAAMFFDGPDADEARVRFLADAIIERADWRWFQRGRADVSMGWHPGAGFIERGWTGYNEGMIVPLLAMGAARDPVGGAAWDAWCATYPTFWRGEGDRRHLAFAPMFGHQYSHAFIDFRGIRDAAMRAANLDYFENSRRATWAMRAYCAANPAGWSGYSQDIWGLTACDGPGDLLIAHRGGRRRLRGYSARGPLGQPDGFDDGTLAPTALVASLPFAPQIVLPAIRALIARHGDDILDRHGFRDAFNPSCTSYEGKLETGRITAGSGWVATDQLGIDQGPIVIQLANFLESTSLWRWTRKSPRIRRGLARAGFTGGWLERPA